MDGKIVSEMLAAEFRRENQPNYEERALTGRGQSEDGWSAEAEAEIADRLKKLGYLG